MKLSVVIPAYNEAENIVALHKKLSRVVGKITASYEVWLVDDGSTDDTFLVAKKISRKDKRFKIIRLSRRFGQTAALSAGFEVSKGEVVVTMDADLQNDPTDIPKMLKLIDQGYDLVSGWRRQRQDKFFSRKLPSVVANKIISKISGVLLHDFGCSLKAYRRWVIEEVSLYGEMHRFIPAVAMGLGARIVEVEVGHHPRKFGKSKYGLSRTVGVILDVILLKFLLSFHSRPMRLFGGLGMILGGTGTLIFIELMFEKFILLKSLSQRPLFLVSIFMIMIGVQMVMIGIFSEMLMRVYFESSDKKTYKIREVWPTKKR